MSAPAGIHCIMSGKYDEQVLVITRELFDQLGAFHGLKCDVDRYLDAIFSEGNNFFIDRNDAEEDPGHKQIIPYAIFRYGGKFLHYIRGKSGGEKRLAAKGSVGIGGHINDTDGASGSLANSTYLAGVDREIREELNISGDFKQRAVALLNDDTNEVGKVHLGVVHLVDLETSEVTSNEEAITELSFFTPEELQSRSNSLETWSRICVEEFPTLLRNS